MARNENSITKAEVQALLNARRRINEIDVREAVLWDGEEVEVSAKRREDFRFTGLSTLDFAREVFEL